MSVALEQLAWRSPSHPDEAANTDHPIAQLSAREIALVRIAADLKLGATEAAFQLDVEAALTDAGLTLDEIRELFRHLAPYAGLSATAMAFERLIEMTDAAADEHAVGAESGLGGEAQEYSAWALEGFRAVDAAFANQLHRYTEDLWDQPGLSKAERSLVTLAIDVANNALGGLFAIHLALAQKHGIDLEKVTAMIRLLGDRLPHHDADALEAVTEIASA